MDISKLDIDFIEICDLSYTVSRAVFGVDPISASGKKQKKIRKWVEKNYMLDADYPQSVMNFISKEVSDADFIKFLKACHDEIQLNGTHRERLFDKNSDGLSDDVREAFWALFEHDAYCGDIRQNGTDVQINVEYGAGYDRILTLLNASGIPEGEFDCLSFEIGGLVKEGNEYKLIGDAENYTEDTSISFAISFTDAKVEINLFRADAQMFDGTPWTHLQTVASTILDKYFLPGECLNDREKELLPLIVEISKLSYWAHIPDEFKEADFSQLKSYILKWGYSALLPLVERLEKGYFNDKKKERIIKKLISKLNKQPYEPLWRELYQMIVDSQTDYPSKASACCSIELLKESRTNIQKLMESRGYSGEYPDFVKQGIIRGIHLAESYGMDYFIGFEKNVVYHIHCIEEYVGKHLRVEFICGTELLRKNESAGDIYSCLFNAKGRRLFRTISYESEYMNRDGEDETNDLEQRVQIAIKKAELQKLTKEERKVMDGFDISYWKLFFFIFILMGGGFAVLFTIGFILLEIVTCLVFDQPQTIPSMLADTSWWTMFLLSWILYGGIMGIIMIIFAKK